MKSIEAESHLSNSEKLTTDGLPAPIRYWAVIIISFGVAISVLDVAIANVALPTIARDLKTDSASVLWVVNAYQLGVVVSLLPLAALGDIYGYRRVFLGGLVLFTLSAFFCAEAHSLPQIAVARGLQGLGAAGLMSVGSVLIRFTYPAKMLGRGIGINAMVVAVSSAIGPSVAAAILAVAPWQWLFLVNVPVGIIACLAGYYLLPGNHATQAKFDWPSAVLNVLTFGLLVLGIEGIAHRQSPIMAMMLLGSAVFFGVIYIRRQLTQPMPLLPLDLLRKPIIALSVLTSVCSFAGQMLALGSLPFFLQDVLKMTAVQIGLVITPMPLTVALIAPLAGHLSDRIPPALLGIIGLSISALGFMLLAFVSAEAGSVAISWRMAVCGLGFGMFQSPNVRMIVGSTPKERSGGAGGLISMSRLSGQTIGASLVALIFSLSQGKGTKATLISAAVIVIVAALLSGSRLSTTGPKTIDLAA